MVLSGMGSMEMVRDNLSAMKPFQPLSQQELDAIGRVRDILRGEDLIPCTACRYCTDGCPQGIAIPDWFAALNAKRQGQTEPLPPREGGRASACVRCGLCEAACPQHLPIRELLKEAAAALE